MKTRKEFLNLVKQVIAESENFSIDPKTGRIYSFMLRDHLSTYLRKYSQEWHLATQIIDAYSETGLVEFTPFQMRLFPIHKTWGDINSILRQVNLQNIVLALGHRYYCGNDVKWQSLVEVPDILKGEIKFSYAGHGHIKISNPEILKEWGIVFPEPSENFTVPVVALKNYISAGFPETMDFESFTELGWWSSDYSGYGSLIRNPFSANITHDWVYNHIRQIGHMADDVIKQKESGNSTWNSYTKTKFLEERVLPFFKENNLGVQVAEGSYSGRPLGMKRGAEDSRQVYPQKLEDFVTFMGLGTFIQRWLEKEPVS